jgi:hypothetical protein
MDDDTLVGYGCIALVIGFFGLVIYDTIKTPKYDMSSVSNKTVMHARLK